MKLIAERIWRYRRILYMQLALSPLLILVSCGGGGGGTEISGEPDPPTPMIGVFLDSAVEGLNYEAKRPGMDSGLSGQTNALGEFSYYESDRVTFSIGDITLGSDYGDSALTPLDFDSSSRTEYTQKVRNIVRLLQSLDLDDNPANGITLPADIHSRASGLSLDFSQASMDFENDAAVSVLTKGLGLVSEEDALAHFQGTIQPLYAGKLQGNYNFVRTYLTDLNGNDLLPPGLSFSGSMTISAEGVITQTIYINGQLVVDEGDTAVIFDHYRILATSAGCTYYVNLSYIPYHPGLGTTVNTAELTADGSQTIGECFGLQPGNDFIEIDYWE